MKIDRRVARTRTALFDALVALIREKDYEAITVEDVLARADVGRSTFYAHFTSKDDLLERSLERLRALLVAATEVPAGAGPGRDAALALFEHVAEYADIRAALATGRGDAVLGAAIDGVLVGYLRQTLPPHRRGDLPRELAIRYIVSTFEAVLQWWGTTRPKVDPAQAHAHFRRLVLGGLPARACAPFLVAGATGASADNGEG